MVAASGSTPYPPSATAPECTRCWRTPPAVFFTAYRDERWTPREERRAPGRRAGLGRTYLGGPPPHAGAGGGTGPAPAPEAGAAGEERTRHRRAARPPGPARPRTR